METSDDITATEPPPEEQALDLTAAEEILDSYPKSRRYLIPILQKIHVAYRYLPEEAMHLVMEELGISKAQVYGIISFYPQLLITEPGKYIVKVCTGTACFVKGASIICNKIDEKYHVKVGETDATKFLTLQTASCFGNCGAAPIIMVGDDSIGNMDPEKTCEILAGYENESEDAATADEKSEA
ncbi:MAG: NAD(P)H-dependent oxidoreductase subunit E [Nitrospinales bacterium]